MESKKYDFLFIISSALALISTVYVFYMAVFNQIISQNEGYFYALIFGLILLIAFVLCNLFTKLIAISVGKNDSRLRLIATIGFLVLLAVIFLTSKMRNTISLSPQESSVYNSAISMIDGTYEQNHDLVGDGLYNPGNYVYSLVLYIAISLFGGDVSAILWTNAVFYVLCGYLAYKLVAIFTDRVCGAFAALLILIMPSQTFAVYSFSSESLVTAIVLGCFLSYSILFTRDTAVTDNEDADKDSYNNASNDSVDVMNIICTVTAAVMTAVAVFSEPIMIIPLLLIVVLAFGYKKNRAFNILIGFAAGLVLFVFLCFVKSIHMNVEIGEAIGKEFSVFDAFTNQNNGVKDDFSTVMGEFNSDVSSTEESIVDNYYFITDSDGSSIYTDLKASWIIVLNQIVYMFVLVMTISCIILSLKEKRKESGIIYCAVFGAFINMFFSQNRAGNGYLYAQLLIVATGVGIHYLYLDHHPEQKVTLNALDALEKTGRKELAKTARNNIQAALSMDEEEFIKRAEALIFIDSDEDLYRQIKSEEHRIAMVKDGHGNVMNETYDDYDEDFFLDMEDDASEPVKVTAVAPSGITERESNDAYEVNANMHAAAKFNKESVPAWKLKPDDSEDLDYFYDEDEPADPDYFDDEESEKPEMKVPKNKNTSPMVEKSEKPVKPVKPEKPEKPEKPVKKESMFSDKKKLVSSAGVTTDEPEPVVTKINRKTKDPKPPKPAKAPKPPKPTKTAKSAKAEKTEKPVKTKEDKQTRAVSSATNTMNNGVVVRRVKTVGGTHATPKNIANITEEEGKYIPNPLPLPKKKEHTGINFDFPDEDGNDDWDE